jgi:hypothetical protein
MSKVLSERRQVKGLLSSLVHFSRKNAPIETRQLGKKSQARRDQEILVFGRV